MKNLVIALSLVAMAFAAIAQSPSAFTFQTVVRDGDGEPLQNQTVTLRMSIHDNAPDGTTLYRETHAGTTNEFGLISLEIGNGTADIGAFPAIDWRTNTKYLEVEIDPEGGSNFASLGTSQLVSVPFALHAETVTNADDADADPNNEFQTISKAGNIVTLSNGGGSFEDATEDADADPGNETNTSVALDGTDLKVTDAGGTITTDLSSLVDDADADPVNELQEISKEGNLVTLSNGGGTFADEVDDADADPANEINTAVLLDGTELKVTDAAGTIITDLSSLVDDADANPTNELQTLSIVGNDLSISNGNMVPLPTSMPVGTSGQTINHDGNGWAACTNLYNDGTNVGIGTTTPASKLEVAGAVRANKFVDAQNTSFYLNPADEQTSGVLKGHLGIGGAPAWIQPLISFPGWGPNLHINTGQDTAHLWIGGHLTQSDAEIGHLSFIGEWNNPMILGDKSSKYASITGKIVSSGGQNFYPSGALIFSTATGAANTFPQIDEPFKEQMRITHEGRVGIGTDSPNVKLDVDGLINTSNAYQINENTVLAIPSSNTFVGMGAGSNTNGNLNTFLGYYAGFSNSGGNSNTFIGRGSGTNNTTGQNNTFVGDETSEGNITGSNNTYIGKSAGWGCNGSGNVFIGYSAGSLETGSNKFYLSNGPDEEDVLISGNFSSGNVGIGLGTTSPTQKLDVNGGVKATSFSGNGSSLTNLDASNMSTGTLNNARFNALSDLGGGSGTTFLRKDGTWVNPPGNTYSAGNDLSLAGTTFSLENDIDVNYVRAAGSSGLKLFDDGGNGVFIEDGGNVGIGTTTPATKLNVYGNNEYIRQSGNSSHWIQMGYHSSLGPLLQGDGYSRLTLDADAGEAGQIVLGVGGDNVGIGVTNPAEKLEVNGKVRLSDEGENSTILSNSNGSLQIESTYPNVYGNKLRLVLYEDDVYFQNTDSYGGKFIFSGATGEDLNGDIIFKTTGGVGIGTDPTVPSATLSVNGSANKPGGGSWAVFSDARSKENVKNFQKGLNELMQLKPVSFSYKAEFDWGTDTYVGLIAQDVEKVVPSMVSEIEVNNIKDFKEVDPSELIYITINAVQEQQTIIEELKAENEALKARLEKLESK